MGESESRKTGELAPELMADLADLIAAINEDSADATKADGGAPSKGVAKPKGASKPEGVAIAKGVAKPKGVAKADGGAPSKAVAKPKGKAKAGGGATADGGAPSKGTANGKGALKAGGGATADGGAPSKGVEKPKGAAKPQGVAKPKDVAKPKGAAKARDASKAEDVAGGIELPQIDGEAAVLEDPGGRLGQGESSAVSLPRLGLSDELRSDLELEGATRVADHGSTAVGDDEAAVGDGPVDDTAAVLDDDAAVDDDAKAGDVTSPGGENDSALVAGGVAVTLAEHRSSVALEADIDQGSSRWSELLKQSTPTTLAAAGLISLGLLLVLIAVITSG